MLASLAALEDEPFVRLADFGCADGGPEMPLVHKLKAMLPANMSLEVCFEDQPNNDFQSLFALANGLVPLPLEVVDATQASVPQAAVGEVAAPLAVAAPAVAVSRGVASWAHGPELPPQGLDNPSSYGRNTTFSFVGTTQASSS